MFIEFTCNVEGTTEKVYKPPAPVLMHHVTQAHKTFPIFPTIKKFWYFKNVISLSPFLSHSFLGEIYYVYLSTTATYRMEENQLQTER